MNARRAALFVLAATLLGPALRPTSAETQARGSALRIGFLGMASPGIDARLIGALKLRLEEHGYVDGHNVSIIYRWADWDRTRFPRLAQELVDLGVDVITAPCGWGLQAVRRASRTVPVAARCIALQELAPEIPDGLRPAEFTTGVTYFVPDAMTRRLEVVRELFPRAARLAVLYRPNSDWGRRVSEVEAEARRLRFAVERLPWTSDAELSSKIADASRHDVLLPLTDGWTLFHVERLVELVAERRLPAVYDVRMFVTRGGLASYGPDPTDVYRKVADQIVRILRGQRPGTMAIERAERLELVINKDTARRLGLTIPPSLLRRADAVID